MKIIENAQKFADTDKKNLAETNLENEVNNLCYQVDKNLSDLGVSDELKEEATNLLESVRSDLETKNIEKLKAGIESLRAMLNQLETWAKNNSTNSSN